MGRAPSRPSIKAARGVICAFARTREGTESRCAPRAQLASARQPRRSGVSAGAGSGGERPGSGGAMGLCCCKDWRGHLRAPKGNSGRSRAPHCSRRHNPRSGPHVLLLPAPARLCRGSRALTLAGASP